MGTLTYDSKLVASFDDRVLAHLQAVIWAKLRRGEPFAFTWTEATASSGFGRTSVWLSPAIPVAFEYFGGRAPRLNASWVKALNRSANSAVGLTIVPEPTEAGPEPGA
ncbi:ATP-dependent DNA ligase [Agromyces aureus]|uniref:ATP-dependent DNA ligase n=1 Tax=Agromyces aureus TaxID=453304 RepID=A0A191WJJ2_9MICO|nr:ATP-dependent DNA ligase [Agromyces aureus]ANJ28333.1 ATP-dependent DNA ligase [Agromyces aureus]